MVDLSGLKDLATADPDGWRAPALDDLCGDYLIVLCFDQSLTSTGFALLYRTPTHLQVSHTDTFRPPATEKKSFEQDYLQALYVEDQAELWLRFAQDEFPNRPLRIVHETPAVANPRAAKKLGPRVGVPGRMAGQAIRSVAHRYRLDGQVRMINAQQAKTFICGNSKADKREAHNALTTWAINAGARLRGFEQVTNEHQRDAVLLGLKVLDNERRSRG